MSWFTNEFSNELPCIICGNDIYLAPLKYRAGICPHCGEVGRYENWPVTIPEIKLGPIVESVTHSFKDGDSIVFGPLDSAWLHSGGVVPKPKPLTLWQRFKTAFVLFATKGN